MAIICKKHDQKYELKFDKWFCPECLKERRAKPSPESPTPPPQVPNHKSDGSLLKTDTSFYIKSRA